MKILWLFVISGVVNGMYCSSVIGNSDIFCVVSISGWISCKTLVVHVLIMALYYVLPLVINQPGANQAMSLYNLDMSPICSKSYLLFFLAVLKLVAYFSSLCYQFFSFYATHALSHWQRIGPNFSFPGEF